MTDACSVCQYSAVCLSDGFDRVVSLLMKKSQKDYTEQSIKLDVLLKQELPHCKLAPFQVIFVKNPLDASLVGVFVGVFSLGTLKLFDRFNRRVFQREIYPAAKSARLK